MSLNEICLFAISSNLLIRNIEFCPSDILSFPIIYKISVEISLPRTDPHKSPIEPLVRLFTKLS